MKKRVVLVLGIVLFVFLVSGLALSDEGLPSQDVVFQVIQQIDKDVEARIKKEVDAILSVARKDISKEAEKIVKDSAQIVDLLNKGKKDEALSLIETNIGKLEILLQEHPEVSLLPVSVEAKVIETILSLDDIKTGKDILKNLVNKGYLQDARHLLEGMVSEIRIDEKNLPIITYPKALGMAAVLIKKDKIDDAKTIITNALGALVIKENIIPLSFIRAEVLLEKCLSELKNNKAKKEELLKYVGVADYEITVAEELGYGKKGEEFKDLHARLKEIKEKINKGEKSTNLINAFIEKLKKFKEKIFNKKEEK